MSGLDPSTPQRRHASRARLIPRRTADYLQLHENVWPEIVDLIRRHNVRNHSIFLIDGELFRYYEYVGADHAADMAAMVANPVMQRWLQLTDACQQETADSYWVDAEDICYLA